MRKMRRLDFSRKFKIKFKILELSLREYPKRKSRDTLTYRMLVRLIRSTLLILIFTIFWKTKRPFLEQFHQSDRH